MDGHDQPQPIVHNGPEMLPKHDDGDETKGEDEVSKAEHICHNVR